MEKPERRSNFSHVKRLRVPSFLYRQAKAVERNFMGLDSLHLDNLCSECPTTEQRYHNGDKHEDKLLLTDNKHLTHHMPCTWLMTVSHSGGSPHANRKSLLQLLHHCYLSEATRRDENRKAKADSLRKNLASGSLFLHK